MPNDRRHFSRVDFQSTVSIKIQGQEYQAELVDISLKGALILLNGQLFFDLNERCVFELKLENNTLLLNIASLIVYRHENHLGLKFKNLDLESMIHLRRLVELNLGDPDKIREELFFLVNSMPEN